MDSGNWVKGMNKIGFVSLGCPKNLVDSQNIITLLMKDGYQVSSSYDDSDLVIINTCGFIDSAIDESMDAICEALEHCHKVLVTGCLGPRTDLIREYFPQVCGITGPHSPLEVMDIVHRELPVGACQKPLRVPKGGVRLTPSHYAYLKISEGCSHRCSFCIIPKIRGKLSSFAPEQILETAQAYRDNGVKELLVVAQDTTAYGSDAGYRSFAGHDRGDLYALTEELAKLKLWLRVHYAYPYPHVDRLIEQMAQGLVLPYMDVPMQHVNRRILKLMKRPGDHDRNLENIARWRQICPDLTIRSTFIVGFPGETEEEFCELLDFIKEARLERVGCFAYSPVHAADANELPDQIPEEVKQERLDRFMMVQQEISRACLAAKVGTIQDVIIDSATPEGIIGRTKGDAPDIDGIVNLTKTGFTPVGPGSIVKAKITGSDDYDLTGEIILP